MLWLSKNVRIDFSVRFKGLYREYQGSFFPARVWNPTLGRLRFSCPRDSSSWRGWRIHWVPGSLTCSCCRVGVPTDAGLLPCAQHAPLGSFLRRPSPTAAGAFCSTPLTCAPFFPLRLRRFQLHARFLSLSSLGHLRSAYHSRYGLEPDWTCLFKNLSRGCLDYVFFAPNACVW